MTRFATFEICLLAGLLNVLSCPAVRGEDGEWGDLTLQVSYDGVPPKPALVTIDVDTKVCQKGKLVDESLVVNAKNAGIANVALWLVADEDQTVPEHSNYAKSASARVPLIMQHCRYEPRVLTVRTTQRFQLQNKDSVMCLPKAEFFEADRAWSYTVPAEETIDIVLDVEERYPVEVGCVLHRWMKSWLIVRDTPYMAVSDTSGKIAIKNLPVGKWNFRLWHERVGFIKTGTLDGKDVEWSRGRIEWEIKAGKNDLGEMKLKPEAFKK